MNRRVLLTLPLTAAAVFAQKNKKKVKMVDIAFFDDAGRMTGVQKVEKVVKTDEEWRAQLTPEQYRIARSHGTEPACAALMVSRATASSVPLLLDATVDSQHSTNQRAAGPAVQAIHPKNVARRQTSLGMVRTEVCARCDAHLGHVFDDGPAPRACVIALTLKCSISWRGRVRTRSMPE